MAKIVERGSGRWPIMNRRNFILGAAGGVCLLHGAAWGECTAIRPTPEQPLGMAYLPDIEPNSMLWSAEEGTLPLVFTGLFTNLLCEPLRGLKVELWHADAQGEYHIDRYRGVGITDAEGKIEFITIRPGNYGNRSAHLNLRVWDDNQLWLTTQLYFPEEVSNRQDALFDPDLTMVVAEEGERATAFYHFVFDPLQPDTL